MQPQSTEAYNRYIATISHKNIYYKKSSLMSYFKEAEQIHNSQNLSEFCRLKQTKVNCVKSLAPATLVVESSYPYHCLQFTVDPRFFITLVYYVLDHLCLLWKIAVCYFLLVIQSWLFRKIVDCLQFFSSISSSL